MANTAKRKKPAVKKETAKENGQAQQAPQQDQVNLLALTEEQALSILDEVTNKGLEKMQATYAVFAIDKLKNVILEVKTLREKVTTMVECNANHPCFDPDTGKCDCSE